MADTNGSRSVVHERTVPITYRIVSGTLACEGCGAAMTEGFLFTRLKMPGGGHANYPFCDSCEPVPPTRQHAGSIDPEDIRTVIRRNP